MTYFLPRKRLPCRWMTPGSVLTALCFVIASGLLSLYANHNPNISNIYGTLTDFIIMMLWIYLGNLSMLLGCSILHIPACRGFLCRNLCLDVVFIIFLGRLFTFFAAHFFLQPMLRSPRPGAARSGCAGGGSRLRVPLRIVRTCPSRARRGESRRLSPIRRLDNSPSRGYRAKSAARLKPSTAESLKV